MPFIGNQPAEAFSSFQKQDFTTSATTSYTLDHPVANQNEIALFINFVRQEPTTAYTASGTSLTLTSATSSSDDMYCVYLGKAIQTVNPPNGSVGLSQLSATGTKDATTFLRGDNTFASAGGTNTPAFFAHLSAEQVVSSATFTKLQANTEIMDVGGYYDNSTNYRYTPLVAGKYFVFGAIHLDATGGNYVDGQVEVRKNGTKVDYIAGRSNTSVNRGTEFTQTVSGIIDMNGSSDYIELWGYLSVNSGTSDFEDSYGTNFGAYKIIE